MSNSRIAECINERCPFSGKPVGADSLTRYGGRVVGFCNPGCRDKFAANPDGFPDALAMFAAIA
jgi:YHS domain-containing protein